MATFFYQSNLSKQAWLASVQVCDECESQKPKRDFRMLSGRMICGSCFRVELMSKMDANELSRLRGNYV